MKEEVQTQTLRKKVAPRSEIPTGMAGSAPRGAFLLLLLANLVFHAAFVVLFVLNPVDYCLTSREAVDYVDVSFVWVQMGAALLAAALAFAGFSLALRPVEDRRRSERLLSIAALMLTGMACCSAGLISPVSDGRYRAIRLLLGVQSACAFVAAYSAYRARKRSKRLPIDLEDIETAPAFRHLFQDAQGRPSLERLEHLLEMRSVRRSIRAELRSGNQMLCWFGLVLGLLSFFGWRAELGKTLSGEPALLDAGALRELNRPDAVEAYFGDTPTQVRGTARVVVVVVSGMRDDALDSVPALRALLGSPEFQRDATRLRLRAPPPSNSVPQWLAMLTGATPELTGVWADKRMAETPFDSVVRQARLHGLSTFATGSPWFTELFHSELMHRDSFFAEGSVPPPYSAVEQQQQQQSDGGAEADRQRLALLRRAMGAADGGGGEGGRKLFQLMVAQLSEADVQGHCAGATAAYNAWGSYGAALGEAGVGLAQLAREMDARTTLLLLADHGSVDRGGSGGAEPQATHVPLVAYRPGSNLGGDARFSSAPRFHADPATMADVAVTLSALLGLPAPRAAEGVFIDELLPLANAPLLPLHYRDLFVQKLRLVRTLQARLGVGVGVKRVAETEPPVGDVTALRDGVLRLRKQQRDTMRAAEAVPAALALALCLGGGSALLLLLGLLVQRASFADLGLVLAPAPGQFANRRACLFGLAAVVCYFVASLCLFLLLLRLRGYTAWDSTLLHFPTEVFVYVVHATLPALLCAGVITRSYHFPYVIMPGRAALAVPGTAPSSSSSSPRAPAPAAGARGRSTRARAVLSEYVRCLFVGEALEYSDMSMIYLCKVYLLCWSVLALLLLLLVQAACSYSFVLPHLLPLRFEHDVGWTSRFQLSTLQLFASVQLLCSAAMLRVWPSNDLTAAHYDKLYSLAMLKHEQQRGASSKSDEVIGLLEEETEALISAHYRTPGGKESDDEAD